MLSIVAIPIGHPKDITLRALDVLRGADIVIGEERRVASTFLKKLDLQDKELYLLNEHSNEKDHQELLSLCRTQNVALISDCGTPSFYDPGFQLVQLCRQAKIKIVPVPGPSSLMTLLSVVSQKLNTFYFSGFLPADNIERQKRWTLLASQNEALVLMDTPYRLYKIMDELRQYFPFKKILLGLNLTQDSELFLEDTPDKIIDELKNRGIEKAEFILIVYGDSQGARTGLSARPGSRDRQVQFSHPTKAGPKSSSTSSRRNKPRKAYR